jgi:hypothetical protein
MSAILFLYLGISLGLAGGLEIGRRLEARRQRKIREIFNVVSLARKAEFYGQQMLSADNRDA